MSFALRFRRLWTAALPVERRHIFYVRHNKTGGVCGMFFREKDGFFWKRNR